MTPKLRNLTITLWALAILGMCALLANWTTSKILGTRKTTVTTTFTSPEKPQPTRISDLPFPAFSVTDQNAATVTNETLKGKIWIADFFFTTCTGPCPMMTAKLATLVKQLPQSNIHFASFTVDPETDTPPVLKEYAAKFTTSPPDPRWHFLVGGDNVVYDLAKALKLVVRPAEGLNPILHTTKFVLVDPTGQVAGYYDYNDPAHMERLIQDAKELATPPN